MIENLEKRIFLALAATLSADGTLTLTSIFEGERYLVGVDTTTSSYTVDIVNEGLHAEFPESQVTKLVIETNQNNQDPTTRGGDFVQINAAVTLPTTVNADVGNDTIFAGSGDTLVNPVDVTKDPNATNDGADSIVGGIGDDTLNGGGGEPAINGGMPAGDTIFG